MEETNFDLMVRVLGRLMELQGKHPAHRHALVYGVKSGVNLGQAWIKAGDISQSSAILMALTEIKKRPITSLHCANAKTPSGQVFSSAMLDIPEYGSGDSAIFYEEGIRIGFVFVVELFRTFERMNFWGALNLTERHLEWVRGGYSLFDRYM